MAGGDKGGCQALHFMCWGLAGLAGLAACLAQALIKLIQATKNPVICICNAWSLRQWHRFRA